MLMMCSSRRYDVTGPSSFYLEHGTWAFAVRKWLGSMKFWLIKQVAAALGYTSLARKVWAGWQVRLVSIYKSAQSASHGCHCGCLATTRCNNRAQGTIKRGCAARSRLLTAACRPCNALRSARARS